MPEPAECVWVGPQRVPVPETDGEWGMLGKVKRLSEELASPKKVKPKKGQIQKRKKVQKKWTTISNAELEAAREKKDGLIRQFFSGRRI